MDKDPIIFVKHILECIKHINEYTNFLSKDEFCKDFKTQDAVYRRFEILGEAAKNLSEEYKSVNSQIPWQDMSDMRNKLIHEYFGVDALVVWKTVKEDLVELKKEIEKLLD